MTWRKRIMIAGGACVGLLAAYVLYILSIAGELRDIEPHFDGSCRVVSAIPGPEDLVILPDGTGAFISSEDRRAALAGKPRRGAVYYYDLGRPDALPVDVTPETPPLFHPHGIGLHAPGGKPTTLYVVNHPRGDVHGDVAGEGPAHTVEVFDVDGPSLRHRRTIADSELLIAPNDVTSVGLDRLYVSNDHGSGDKTQRMLEDYLRMRRAHLLYFDGERFTRLPGTYRYANGIEASPDGRTIYLATPTDRQIVVLERDPSTNALTRRTEIFVDTGPDNINMDADGHLWVGAHPKMLTLKRHMEDATIASPSQVLRLSPKGTGAFTVEEVLLSDGSDLPSSSAAARHGDRLLVGSVFGPGFLDCRISSSAR